jgi:protein SCO1/2
MTANTPATTLRVIRWTAWGLILAIAAVAAYVLLSPEQKKGAAIGGPFTMRAMTGETIDIGKAEAGKPHAVFFGFTHCPDICPTAMFEMSQLLRKLGDKTKDFRVYFVSVDPARDTPEQLKLYLSAFDERIIGMSPASEEELATVARQYRAFYRRVPTPSGYTMDHTATIYLFDRKGEFFGTLAPDDNENARLAKMERLLGR